MLPMIVTGPRPRLLLLLGLAAPFGGGLAAESVREARGQVRASGRAVPMPETVMESHDEAKIRFGPHGLALRLQPRVGAVELQQLDRDGTVIDRVRFPADQGSSRVRLGSWNVRTERLSADALAKRDGRAGRARAGNLGALRRGRATDPLAIVEADRRRIDRIARPRLFERERASYSPPIIRFDAEQRAIAVLHAFVDLRRGALPAALSRRVRIERLGCR
jgi:hypothetical protein